jgi:hypothetical protein
MRSARVFHLIWNLPTRVFPQTKVKPMKLKVSGLPSHVARGALPRSARTRSAGSSLDATTAQTSLAVRAYPPGSAGRRSRASVCPEARSVLVEQQDPLAREAGPERCGTKPGSPSTQRGHGPPAVTAHADLREPRRRAGPIDRDSLEGTSNNSRFRRFLSWLSEWLPRACRGASPIGDHFASCPAAARSFARCHTDSTRERAQAGAAAIRSS